MKETLKEKMLHVRDFMLARGKIVFPVLLIAAVAVTVTIALRAGSHKTNETNNTVQAVESVSGGDVSASNEVPDIPFEEVNAHPEVNELIAAYYQARAEGNADAVGAIQNEIDEMEKIRIQEFGKYIESYPFLEVYTKPGPEENTYIAVAYTRAVLSYYPEDFLPGYETFYVCQNEDGSYFINKGVVEEWITEYIRKVIMQDDVVELYNKIQVEYNDVCREKPELLQYISMVEQQVQTAAGIVLAQQVAGDVSGDAADGSESGGNAGSDGNGTDTTVPESPAADEPVYATATTTVNVRSSDSETADKLGKLSNGTKVKVLEQKPNGWSRIEFEKKDGYVKSQYLSIAESASNVETIGTVTATTNVNVRATASQTSQKLGVAVGGESFDLVAREGDWCKIIYNGQIGYIKSEYVQ